MLSIICFILFSFKYSSNAFHSLSLCIPHQVFFSLSPVFLLLLKQSFFKNPSSNLAFTLNPLSGSLNHALSLLKIYDSKAADLCISRDGSPNTSQVRPLL